MKLSNGSDGLNERVDDKVINDELKNFGNFDENNAEDK